MKLQKTTLAFLIRENQILLAMKKRGFGAGKWNGYGGKVKEKKGESIKEAMAREMKEEIGVKPLVYKQQAVLKFLFHNAPQNQNSNQECYVFLIDKWQGEPQESEEMKPQWVPISKIPYAKMWIDDSLWLPKVLARKNLKAEFVFDSKGEKILKHKIDITK